eukprot:TRINITY_DN457_c0_g1_i2.p1 TRINITY_DN457_c0_g1~~TRINITY_DN457_c0_g1_i2.p1  ORF type:complete len:130 (+),score=28.19 TRINITY_DN457_c0_g1_i2:63-452(+)
MNQDHPQEKARKYLEKHKILQLFERLCVELVYEKPQNPREFLIGRLEELRHASEEEKRQPVMMSLFTESDLDTMFSMFDPVNKGIITSAQLKNALNTLGVSISSHLPSSAVYTREDFKRMVRATFQASA